MNRKEKKNKLKDLRIYGKWRDNVENEADYTYAEYILNKDIDWKYFISHSFQWHKTIEGYNFWKEISNK